MDEAGGSSAEAEAGKAGTAKRLEDWRAAERTLTSAVQALSAAERAVRAAEMAEQTTKATAEATHAALEAARRAEDAARQTADWAREAASAAREDALTKSGAVDSATTAEAAAHERYRDAEERARKETRDQ